MIQSVKILLYLIFVSNLLVFLSFSLYVARFISIWTHVLLRYLTIGHADQWETDSLKSDISFHSSASQVRAGRGWAWNTTKDPNEQNSGALTKARTAVLRAGVCPASRQQLLHGPAARQQ